MSNRFDEALAGGWRLDPPRSSVEFRARHFWGLITVKGHFDAFEGRLDLSAEPAIKLTIDAGSVQTGNRKRDRHLRSADFFDVEHQPWIRFASDSAVLDDDSLRVRGRLSARADSIPLELDARLRRVDGELLIEAVTSAPHRELGMHYSPLGMIGAQSELRVSGYLVPIMEDAAVNHAGDMHGSATR